MLILVAVTITMAVNGGLFDYAGKATGETQNAINKEQELANLQANMTVDKLIDKYTTGDGATGGITASVVQSDLVSYLGKEVDYGVEYTDSASDEDGKWQIFYADNKHVYLISKGYVANDINISGYNGTSDFAAENGLANYPAVANGLFNKTYNPSKTPALQYTGINDEEVSYENIKATQYLLDSTKWTAYKDEGGLAEWIIGAPTLEMLVQSYNAYYTDKQDVSISEPEVANYGYETPFSSGDFPINTYLNPGSSNYWLACPGGSDDNDLYAVHFPTKQLIGASYGSAYGFRPIVCLNTDVTLTWDEATSQYLLD